MEFAPSRAWEEISYLWNAQPQWLQATLLILGAVVILYIVIRVVTPPRPVRSPDLNLPGPPPRSPSERYPYLALFRDLNIAIALIALTVFATPGITLILAGGYFTGFMFLAVGFAAFLFTVVWSDVIQLALNIERHLRNLRYDRPVSANREAAPTRDDEAPDK